MSKNEAAICAAQKSGSYFKFFYKGFLKGLAEIDRCLFSPNRKPFRNRHIFSYKLSKIGKICGDVCKKIFALCVKFCDVFRLITNLRELKLRL